jgi:hypothetical protein
MAAQKGIQASAPFVPHFLIGFRFDVTSFAPARAVPRRGPNLRSRS